MSITKPGRKVGVQRYDLGINSHKKNRSELIYNIWKRNSKYSLIWFLDILKFLTFKD